MFIRMSAAFLSVSCKIAGRSSGARRCLFALAPCGAGSALPMGLFIRAPAFFTPLGPQGLRSRAYLRHAGSGAARTLLKETIADFRLDTRLKT
jgi:hypothetical protein